MDGLFTGPAGERRRFLDRLVLAVDSDHGARVTALERALRNRNRLLEERRGEKIWLDAAEREIAELAIAVAAARRETVERLAALIAAGRDDEFALSLGRHRAGRRNRPADRRAPGAGGGGLLYAPCCAKIAPATPPPDAR